jgi:hypothetical protein
MGEIILEVFGAEKIQDTELSDQSKSHVGYRLVIYYV